MAFTAPNMEGWFDCECGHGMVFDSDLTIPNCPHCGRRDGWDFSIEPTEGEEEGKQDRWPGESKGISAMAGDDYKAEGC